MQCHKEYTWKKRINSTRIGYFSKHTKKTVEDVELLEENEDYSKISGQSSPPKISGSVQDIQGYTEHEYTELANENEEGINKGESIMDM